MDLEIKKRYELAYFSRNFKAKIRDAYEWGLSDEDISLLIGAWEIKAKNLGGDGIQRWKILMDELPGLKKRYAAAKGVAWVRADKAKELQRIGLSIERNNV
jgi:hypothetical protein